MILSDQKTDILIYDYFWCIEFLKKWRIFLIDFLNDFNIKEMIYHEKFTIKVSAILRYYL